MRKFSSILLMALVCSHSAFAAAEQQIPDWIQPGVKVVLTPIAGSGSIVMAVTQDRKVFFCGAEPDANNHTPIPGHCNVVITKPGFALPIDEFMKGQSGWKTNMKIFFKGLAGIVVLAAPAASSLVTGAGAYGVAAAQGVGSVWNFQIQSLQDQAEMANSIKRVIMFGNERDCGVPSIPVANSYGNMKDNLISRMNEIAKKLIDKGQDLKNLTPGLAFTLAGHTYISSSNANASGPQTEEDQVAAVMTDIEAARQKNIVAPAIASGTCIYQPIPAAAQASVAAASMKAPEDEPQGRAAPGEANASGAVAGPAI